MLPISQSLMLSHSQLDILKKNSYSSQVSNTFVLFKKDQILKELVEAQHSSSSGGERRVQFDEDVLQLWPGREKNAIDKYNSEIQSQSKSHPGTYTQTEWPLVWLPVWDTGSDDGYRRNWCFWRLWSSLPCHPRRISWVIVRSKQGSVLWAADAGYGRRIHYSGRMDASVGQFASVTGVNNYNADALMYSRDRERLIRCVLVTKLRRRKSNEVKVLKMT